MTDSLISIRALHKTFRRGPETVNVLQGIDLDIRTKESLAIIGASGTGKSTLLHLLGGLEKPDAGAINYAGRNICAMRDREMAAFRNRTIGFVFQFHFLLPEFNALENVMMPALITTRRRKDLERRAEALLETVGLSHRLQHKPGEMSGGEQQRVAIARALMMEPKVLLADEPTGDLDPATGIKIIELFAQIRESMNVTMIIVTHNMDLAKAMGTTLRLVGGQLEPYGI